MKPVCSLLLILTCTGSALALDDMPTAEDETNNQLKTFAKTFAAAMKDVYGDDQITKAGEEVKKLSKKIADERLPTVEKFALRDAGKEISWVLARLLV